VRHPGNLGQSPQSSTCPSARSAIERDLSGQLPATYPQQTFALDTAFGQFRKHYMDLREAPDRAIIITFSL